MASAYHTLRRNAWAPGSEWLRSLKRDHYDTVAVLIVALNCIAAFLGCAMLGVTFRPPLWIVGLIPGFFLLLASGFHLWRPADRRLFRMLAYLGLWGALPIAGTQLSLIGSMANFPLRTPYYVAMDQGLHFDWFAWAEFVQSHPYFRWITDQAYLSYSYQPYAAVLLLATWAPSSRNANFLIATALALGVTLTVSTLAPAIEPGRAYGFATPAADQLLAVRAGQRADLAYIGVICFPSFHAAMATLFTLAYRGMPRALAFAAALNLLMMVSALFSGDHYLVDLIAGFVVALAAQIVANRATDQRLTGANANRPCGRSTI